ncbi:MAG: hemerythrin domain-containing protein [Acidimicrobiales bacterium]
MAHLTRFLMQDHARIFRALDACAKDPNSLPTALNACNEIESHMTIEEELVYPLLRDEIDGREADESEAEHAEARELIAAVRDLEPGDPSLGTLMQQIQKAVGEHVDHEESAVLPRIHEHLLAKEWDLGRIAFGMRQELLGENDRPKALSAARMNPNAGWTHGSVPLAGW